MLPEFNLLAKKETRTIPPEIPKYPTLNIELIFKIMKKHKLEDLLFLIENSYNNLKDILDQKTKGKKFAGEMIVELDVFQDQLKNIAQNPDIPEETKVILEKFLTEVEEERQKEIKIIRDNLSVQKAF